MLNINELLERLLGARYFSSIDLDKSNQKKRPHFQQRLSNVVLTEFHFE